MNMRHFLHDMLQQTALFINQSEYFICMYVYPCRARLYIGRASKRRESNAINSTFRQDFPSNTLIFLSDIKIQSL